MLRAHAAHRLVAVRQFLHHRWREIAREIGAFGREIGLPQQQLAGAPRLQGEDRRDDDEDDDFLDAVREVDAVGVEQVEDAFIAGQRLPYTRRKARDR